LDKTWDVSSFVQRLELVLDLAGSSGNTIRMRTIVNGDDEGRQFHSTDSNGYTDLKSKLYREWSQLV